MEFTSFHYLVFVVIGAYGLGSIPFGFILTRKFGLGDIRTIGSGNIGATNVLRTGNKELAIATLILDGLKGVVALLLARLLASYIAIEFDYMVEVAIVAAVVGHCFPVWLKFHGGKGVATVLCSLLAYHYVIGLICAAVWLFVFALTKISSLSSLSSVFALPFVAFILTNDMNIAFFMNMLTLLVIYRHKDNIKRILAGEEKPSSFKKDKD